MYELKIKIRGTLLNNNWISEHVLNVPAPYTIKDIATAAKKAGFKNFALPDMIKLIDVDTLAIPATNRKRVEYHDKEMQKFYKNMGCDGYSVLLDYDYYVKVNDTYRFFTKSGKRYDINENDIISM